MGLSLASTSLPSPTVSLCGGGVAFAHPVSNSNLSPNPMRQPTIRCAHFIAPGFALAVLQSANDRRTVLSPPHPPNLFLFFCWFVHVVGIKDESIKAKHDHVLLRNVCYKRPTLRVYPWNHSILNSVQQRRHNGGAKG